VTTPALVRAAEPLTPREREVALLAGAGATSREVAARLGVSVRTVDNHLASIYRKAGIGGRHELGELFADPGAGQR
jgi:DNA-binding CsgD family transcriptional regulator